MRILSRVLMVVVAVVVGMVAPALGQETYGPAARATTAPTTNEDFGADTNPLAILGRVGETIEGSRGGGAGGGGGGAAKGGLSSSINILVVLTVIGLAPSIMLMCTCFVRIMIVLGLVKQALGTQTLPPPQVIVGLSMFMTLLVMSPTMDRIHKEAVVPYRNGEIRDYDELWLKAKQPLREFMFDQIEATGNWSSVYTILNYRGVDTSEPEKMSTDDVDMVSLVPAFMLSELKTGFLLGFKVYLPFLVIDIVISSLLISMGMMMLPPVLISLPFKLLLFVLVDGWTLVVGSLLRSFVTHPAAPAVSEALGPVVRVFGFG
ncbi:MAG TPA: flagellar type III secretion system pore protein FliP [Phycisphaerales bacterium]|nr:flagellar type III secretion system pore protein FliP [Phycisphaerales bacterium]